MFTLTLPTSYSNSYYMAIVKCDSDNINWNSSLGSTGLTVDQYDKTGGKFYVLVEDSEQSEGCCNWYYLTIGNS